MSEQPPGYAQNGAMMFRKLRQLQHRLDKSLGHEYPGGVEMVCPDGTIALAPSIQGDSEKPRGQPTYQDLMDMNLRGWWKNLDTVNRYNGIIESLEMLAAMLRENHFDGIIGFSQGATLATMLAALCEGDSSRLRALAEQGEPVVIAPPQPPFKFALLSCGYKGTEKYYSGFYNPRLTTPILFDIATLDHMVETSLSNEWISVSHTSQNILRRGGHWFPTDEKSLCSMVSFASQALATIRSPRHGQAPANGTYSAIRITNLRQPQDEHDIKQWVAMHSASTTDTPILRGRSRCTLKASGALRVQPVHGRARGICGQVTVVE
jgi:hypothetical protein